MSGLAPRDCYFLGWVPPVVQTHFDGLTVLSRAQAGATGELASRTHQLIEWWPKRGPVVVERVMHLDGILRGHGLTPPPPPRDDASFALWTKGIGDTTKQQIADHETDPPEVRLHNFHRKWAHQLGYQLGDLIETLDLGAICMYLLGGATEHPFLCAQIANLRQAQIQGRANLERFVGHVTAANGLPPAAIEQATHGARVLAAAPLISPAVLEGPAIEAAARQLEALAVPAAL